MTKKKAKRKTKRKTKTAPKVVVQQDDGTELPLSEHALAEKYGAHVLESVPDEVAADYDTVDEGAPEVDTVRYPDPLEARDAGVPTTRAAKDRSEVYGGKGRGNG